MPENMSPNGLKVLLVEDSVGDALLTKKALRLAFPNELLIQHVVNLESALRILDHTSFDVVLLDLSLPDTSGFDGLLSLQNIAPKLPIIILTAYADETVALQAVLHGAQDYLFKDKMDGYAIKRSIQFAVQRKRFEETLIIRANFDTLTGLVNRTLFENRLDIALAKHARVNVGLAVFLLDLDHFKQVNDTLGHDAGDQLLQQVAERLKKSVRPYDTVSRFGGDEFALLLDGVDQKDYCLTIAEKITQQIAEPFMINGQAVYIGASVGIATNLNGENFSRKSLMQSADTDMYDKKHSKQLIQTP
jgi:two-component system cell cycle response regulator